MKRVRTKLAGGNTETVAGLVEVPVAAETATLAEAVASVRLTDAQRDQMRTAPKFRGSPSSRGGHGFRGPHAAPPAGESGYRFGGGAEPPTAA